MSCAGLQLVSLGNLRDRLHSQGLYTVCYLNFIGWILPMELLSLYYLKLVNFLKLGLKQIWHLQTKYTLQLNDKHYKNQSSRGVNIKYTIKKCPNRDISEQQGRQARGKNCTRNMSKISTFFDWCTGWPDRWPWEHWVTRPVTTGVIIWASFLPCPIPLPKNTPGWTPIRRNEMSNS